MERLRNPTLQRVELGFHGCDRAVAEALLTGTPFSVSENDWDWLGSGVYLWEANPLRGLEFARQLQHWRKGKKNEISDPYVVGAVVDLGFCLDLTSSTGIQAVIPAHADFLDYCSRANVDVPQNTGGEDFVFRRLDCAVINHLHKVREATKLPPFDSVKGVFTEGGPIYPGSGFHQKTHVQLCVRNLDCIKGVFRVSDDQLQP
jgi:hypothetical protein